MDEVTYLRRTTVLSLQDRDWSTFHLTELFDSIQRGKRLKRADQQQGTIPYVSSSALNNGVDGFISKANGCRVFSDCISLANSGSVGSAFYEPFEFVASDHVTHLKRKGLKKEHYLFLVATLGKQASNFNFNREINDQRIQGMQVMLPIDTLGNPDWKFMEDYIREREAIQVERCREFLMKRAADIEIERERESNRLRAQLFFLVQKKVEVIPNQSDIQHSFRKAPRVSQSKARKTPIHRSARQQQRYRRFCRR